MKKDKKLLDIVRDKIRFKHYSLSTEKTYVYWIKHYIFFHLMYGCGLRMNEALNLRIKDLDFGFDKIYIWDSKSLQDRTIPLPQKLKEKFPRSKLETKWQYLFLMKKISIDPRSKEKRRHHIHPKTLSRNIKNASQKANLNKRVTSHIFRHSYATHLFGHKSVETTMIYTHVVSEMNKTKLISPLDF